MKHKLKIDMKQDNLLFGDCKDWLPFIPDNSVDLIYIDPPFFSKKNYEIIWGNGYERRCFEDRRKGEVNHYIGWMKDRLIEAHRVLKNGSMLLHCDYHANHHLRLLLDELFGEHNFINEIIWCYDVGGRSSRRFGRKHDNIYFYSKVKNHYYFDAESAKEFGKPRKTGKESFGGIIKKDENGRLYHAKKAKSGKYYYYFLDEKKNC